MLMGKFLIISGNGATRVNIVLRCNVHNFIGEQCRYISQSLPHEASKRP